MPNTGDGGGKGKLDAAKRLGMSKHQGNIHHEQSTVNTENSFFEARIRTCNVRIILACLKILSGESHYF